MTDAATPTKKAGSALRWAVVAVVLSAALGAVLLWARRGGEAGFREGRWEIVISDASRPAAGRDGGAPARPPAPPQTVTECLTAESPVPVGGLPPGCSVWDTHVEGAHLRWRVHCSLGFQGDGVGLADVSGEALSGTLSLRRATMNSGPRTSLYKLTGRRLGDCQ